MQQRQRRRRRHDLILDHLTALTNAEIRLFLKRHKIGGASAQAKDEYRGILRKAIKDDDITTEQVVAFLDEVTPWGKQHVYLYTGPATKDWRKKDWVESHFKTHKLDAIVDATTDTIVLPEELQLACINWTPQRLRVTAIRKREGWVRSEEHDNSNKKAPDGRPLWLKGYVYQVLRGVTAFEWNLVSNEAFLQITQLPSGASYEVVAEEFMKKVQPWLDLSAFATVDVRPAVKKLHELEEQGKAAAVSHALDYGRVGGRRISFRSTSSKVPLVGDTIVDGMLKTVRTGGIPQIGDFYFDEQGAVAATDGKPHSTQSRRHVIIMAERRRINFATPGTENDTRNVLTLLRNLSK